MKQPAIYILCNKPNGTLYVGITSDLLKRVTEHRMGSLDGFTKKHGCKHLAYFELCETMELAITREKQLKGGSRAKKIKLITAMNPEWQDLYDSIL